MWILNIIRAQHTEHCTQRSGGEILSFAKNSRSAAERWLLNFSLTPGGYVSVGAVGKYFPFLKEKGRGPLRSSQKKWKLRRMSLSGRRVSGLSVPKVKKLLRSSSSSLLDSMNSSPYCPISLSQNSFSLPLSFFLTIFPLPRTYSDFPSVFAVDRTSNFLFPIVLTCFLICFRSRSLETRLEIAVVLLYQEVPFCACHSVGSWNHRTRKDSRVCCVFCIDYQAPI